MSIRTKMAAKIAANAPPGANVDARTRQFMHLLIGHFWPKTGEIDPATLAVCDWEDADEFVYLGRAHAIMIGGAVTPLRYGQVVDARLAREIRDSSLDIVPVSTSGVKPKHPSEPPPETDDDGASDEGDSDEIEHDEEAEKAPPTLKKPPKKRRTPKKAG